MIIYVVPINQTGIPIEVKLNNSSAPYPSCWLISLTRRFTELPKSVIVPPNNVANDNGRRTFDGEIFLLAHQPSTKGNKDATTGVLGTMPDIGAIRNAKKAINLLEVFILSEAINSLTLSNAPLLNKADDIANNPIRVINDGLPKPDNAFWGVSTPVTIKIATHNNPVSSGAIVFLTNNITERSKTITVINASKLSLKK
tara:strand:- start:292 stop:888 length:597 start_codon:yes stop_codon:yes gene_type:complete